MSEHNTTSDNEYSIVSSFDLFEGMNIPCEMYYRLDGKYSVAFRNSTLNKVTLIQLQKLEMTYGNIFVHNSDLAVIESLIKLFKENSKYKDFTATYESIQNDANSIIDDAFSSKTIDRKKSEILSFRIKDTIVTVDASLILQAINNTTAEDRYLYNHSVHVAFLNGLMGKWLKLTDMEIINLVKVGFLHDIGKTKIPPKILNKPASLTDEEFEVIKTHPLHSFNMLIEAGETDLDVLIAVRGHHEKTNGTGYPDKLSYDKITLFARITTIADIYDAMVAKRSYKSSHSPFEVLDEFSRGRFSNLDMQLINIFLSNLPSELINKKVILSNGSVGMVLYVNPNNYAYPIVKVDDEIIATSDELKCISICE